MKSNYNKTYLILVTTSTISTTEEPTFDEVPTKSFSVSVFSKNKASTPTESPVKTHQEVTTTYINESGDSDRPLEYIIHPKTKVSHIITEQPSDTTSTYAYNDQNETIENDNSVEPSFDGDDSVCPPNTFGPDCSCYAESTVYFGDHIHKEPMSSIVGCQRFGFKFFIMCNTVNSPYSEHNLQQYFVHYMERFTL